MTGFSETEKLIIANVARYHKGSIPKEKHADFMALSEKDREIVYRLGAILRLAAALDRDYGSKIKDVKFKQDKTNMYLIVANDKQSEVEQYAVDVKKDMFEAAFGCDLHITGNYFRSHG